MFKPFSIVLVALACVLAIPISMAQPGAPSTCTPLVEQAIAQLGDNCSGLERNSACYGYTLVQAALSEETVPDDINFDVPQDRASLSVIDSLRTAALDEDSETWGIAVLNTQANLPGTLPGQGVVLMLLGDTEIANQVPADAAASPPNPVDATLNVDGARIRTGAGLNFNILTVADAGEPITVDGQSEDGEWVRVVYGTQAGWIFADLVNLPADVDLPTLNDELRAPMQSFYFTTGLGNPDCNEAPNSLLIQSPDNVRVNLTINEAEVTIGSTVILETTPDGQMIIYVIDGTAEVNNLIIPAGYKAFVPIQQREDIINTLNEQGIRVVSADTLPSIDGEWRSCATITDEDRQRFSQLEGIPQDVLNYSINLPSVPQGICASPEELLAAVSGGGTNNGQGIGQVVGNVDCRNFRPTSPLTGMNWQQQQFFWDPAPGAASYVVRVYDENGQVVGEETTTATNALVITGIQDEIGGVTYSWEVAARNANGSEVCVTNRIQTTRGAAPDSWLSRNSVVIPGPPEVQCSATPPATYCYGSWCKAPSPTCWVCVYSVCP